MKFSGSHSRSPLAFALATVLAGASCGPTTTWLCLESGESNRTQGLNALTRTLWTTPEIRVCWESWSMKDTTEEDRALVRRAVEETWNAALDVPEVDASKRFRFTGWESCEDDAVAKKSGVRIFVTDVRPHVRVVGSDLAGAMAGMVLNFTFKNWSPICSESGEENRQYCISTIAAHEFGHALGLLHEQNREDTPESCTESPQGYDGDRYVGHWDIESMMNYCNPFWSNSGRLSDSDARGIRSLYYPELSALYCSEI